MPQTLPARHEIVIAVSGGEIVIQQAYPTNEDVHQISFSIHDAPKIIEMINDACREYEEWANS